MAPPVAIHDAPDTAMTMLVEVLREQLQQAQQEKACFLAMLEAEQQARRNLETKLLPAPRPASTGKVRSWALVVILLVALAGLVVTLIRPELIGGLTGG